jgi:hypothetical protein
MLVPWPGVAAIAIRYDEAQPRNRAHGSTTRPPRSHAASHAAMSP